MRPAPGAASLSEIGFPSEASAAYLAAPASRTANSISCPDRRQFRASADPTRPAPMIEIRMRAASESSVIAPRAGVSNVRFNWPRPYRGIAIFPYRI